MATEELRLSLDVRSQDFSTIQRIQREALGGQSEDIRLYALLFRHVEGMYIFVVQFFFFCSLPFVVSISLTLYSSHDSQISSVDIADQGVETPVSLIVTDEMILLVDENFLESKGLASRYIVMAMEPMEELVKVVLKTKPTFSEFGSFALQFGHRSVFRGNMTSREWHLR